MPVSDDIQEAIGEVYDALRDDLFLSNTDTLTLIKPSLTANEYTDVIEITEGWFFEYEQDRQSLRINIAASFEDLTDSMEQATHVRINDDVYVIRKADTTPPLGTDLTWKIFCDRFTKRSQHVELY